MKHLFIASLVALLSVAARADSSVVIETASRADGFKKLPVQRVFGRNVTSNQPTTNEPLRTLTDGRLVESFGSIFGNGVHDGAYKMDLGAVKPVSAVTSWSHNQAGRRGAQKLTIYASNAPADPGWDLSRFTPLGDIDTGAAKDKFTAASLRAAEGKTLGDFRWIVWAVSHVNDLGGGENTAFQEFAVDVVGEPLGIPPEVANGPNIVFLMTDDQRWDTFGCYGRTDVKTPHIDELAAQGVVFDNAHYAVAICMPSRVTMFTGRYLSDHQVGFTYPYNRTLPKEEFADSYPARLRAVGYRTGFVGKFGIRLEHMPSTAAEHFDFFAMGGMRWPQNDAELHKIYRPDRPKEERTIKKGDAMIRFLDTQPKGQPFCLSISFDAVKNDNDHDMYSPHVEIFKDKNMFVPGNWVEGKNQKLPKLLDHWRGTGLHMHYTSTPEKYQTLARRFATQGYTVDQQVGRLMTKLKEMGLLDNTVVIFTSDNGRFHGSHGLFDKALLYEESMKAPLVVFDGRTSNDQRGRREDALISSADFAPTILALAGLEASHSMKGHDFSGVLSGSQDMTRWQDAVFMESLFIQEIHSAGVRKHTDIPGLSDEIIAGNRSYRCRGVRTKRWKYFVYYEHTPVIEELYDLKVDPLEQDNLARDPQHSEILLKLRAKTQERYTHATE